MAYLSAIYISSIENFFIDKLGYLYFRFFTNQKNILNLISYHNKENTIENFYTHIPISIFKKKSYLLIVLFHFSKLTFNEVKGLS